MYSCVLCLCLSSVGQNPELPPPLVVAPAREIVAIPICDFARAFKPQCGSYEVVLLNPVTCCPEKVCFDLPPGCPIVRCGKRSITFDYGRCCVTIRFRILCGRVAVLYT